jgi:short-subunit dehydrogenase involved in D-alanine esterification of teichoic acids
MSFRFTNFIVLITGGTSGIGLTTAVAFIKENASKVIVCGRTMELLMLPFVSSITHCA